MLIGRDQRTSSISLFVPVLCTSLHDAQRLARVPRSLTPHGPRPVPPLSRLPCPAALLDTKNVAVWAVAPSRRLRVTQRLHRPLQASQIVPAPLALRSDCTPAICKPRLPRLGLGSAITPSPTVSASPSTFWIFLHTFVSPSTEAARSFASSNPPPSTAWTHPSRLPVSARVQSLVVPRTLVSSRSQHCHRGPDPAASH